MIIINLKFLFAIALIPFTMASELYLCRESGLKDCNCLMDDQIFGQNDCHIIDLLNFWVSSYSVVEGCCLFYDKPDCRRTYLLSVMTCADTYRNPGSSFMFRAWNRFDNNIKWRENGKTQGIYCSYEECSEELGIPGYDQDA